ncbi:hypothetical protein ACSBR2_003830 [Camellia fascicularis]
MRELDLLYMVLNVTKLVWVMTLSMGSRISAHPHFRVACIISCGTSERSPDKILSITVSTFEALTQFGTATITTKNIGEVEASYSLTVRNCVERCKLWSRNSRILCFNFFIF